MKCLYTYVGITSCIIIMFVKISYFTRCIYLLIPTAGIPNVSLRSHQYYLGFNAIGKFISSIVLYKNITINTYYVIFRTYRITNIST